MSLAVRVTPAVAAAQAAAPIPSCRAPGALLPTAQRVFHAAARAVPARRAVQAGLGPHLSSARQAEGLRGAVDRAWQGVRAPPRQPPTDKTMTAAVVAAAGASSAGGGGAQALFVAA